MRRSASAAKLASVGKKSPTAVHVVRDVHDAPSRTLSSPGRGVGWTVHAVPFQASARVTGGVARLEESPTAVHAFFDVHDTPCRTVPLEPVGMGVGCTDHTRPSHLSASGKFWPLDTSGATPTAVHDLMDVHDTPKRSSLCVAAGMGVGCALHWAPSHDSANVTTPDAATDCPTAMQKRFDAHETPDRALALDPIGPVIGWSVHVRPSHVSANGTSTPCADDAWPTAMQERVEVHDTAERMLCAAPVGFGVGWSAQE